MNFKTTFALTMILLATLACTLTGGNETQPTLPPSPIQQALNPSPTTGQIPTVATTAPTQTQRPANTAAPTRTSCTPRTDWQIMTVASGDTLSSIASRAGTTVDQLVAANCLANANSIIAGQQLRVPVIPATSTVAVPTQSCTNKWFFTFNSGKLDPLTPCPNPLQTMDAVGQDFEGGRVVWYKGSVVGSQDMVYVIYNDGTWEQYVDTWTPGQMEADLSLVPPSGRFQPVRGIGKVWREQPGVRTKLGWAYEAEKYFQGRRQEPAPAQVTFVDLYLDLGARSTAVRLRISSGGPGANKLWEVAGVY